METGKCPLIKKILFACAFVASAWYMGGALLNFFLLLYEMFSGKFYNAAYFSFIASCLVFSSLLFLVIRWTGGRLFAKRAGLKSTISAIAFVLLVAFVNVQSGELHVHLENPWLFREIHDGNTYGVRVLLASGVEPDIANKEGSTPLMAATYGGYVDIVQWLLTAGADVNKRHKEYGFTPLMAAASEDHAEIATMLLDQGADVNTRDNVIAWTALMHAAKFAASADTVRVLLDRGSDINAKDQKGRSALMLAAANGHPETVRILLDHGAEPGAEDADGCTATDLAAAKGYLDIVELLREAAAGK